jgi:hypothetical protein
VSKTDWEIIVDLRESVDRVWATARRLGLLRLDVPVRRRLLEIKPSKKRRSVQRVRA